MKEGDSLSLPKGWEIKTWDDVLEIRSGRNQKEVLNPEGKYPIIGSAGKVMGFADSYLCDEGTTIVGRKGTIDKPLFMETKFWNVDTAFGLIAGEKLNKKYLFNFCLSYDFKSLDKGTTLPSLVKKDLVKIQIPIPPLSEQKQIVTLLDEAFAAIDQAKANIEKNIENAIEFYENWVQELFENPKKNWQNKKWGELCHFVRGPFGGSLKKSMFKDEGYVVYEQKHAIHNHFNQLRYFIDEEKFNEMKRFEVKPGDIIMSCSGVTLGRVAIIPKDIPRGIINQALLKLTPNKDVSVDFIKYWLRSNIFQNIIFEHAGGAAIPNVPSAKILKEIIIPFPSLKEQHEVVSQIDLMNLKINEIKKGYLKKKEVLEELKKSILHKAFAGELTEQLIIENV